MRWSGQPSESVNESSQQPAVGQTDHWVIKKLGILENNLGSLPDPFVLFIFSCVLLFQWLVFFSSDHRAHHACTTLWQRR